MNEKGFRTLMSVFSIATLLLLGRGLYVFLSVPKPAWPIWTIAGCLSALIILVILFWSGLWQKHPRARLAMTIITVPIFILLILGLILNISAYNVHRITSIGHVVNGTLVMQPALINGTTTQAEYLAQELLLIGVFVCHLLLYCITYWVLWFNADTKKLFGIKPRKSK